MIITGQNIFPIATQKNLSFNINFTPKDFSLSTISFKENKDFTFTLNSGKLSDINNRSVYFYNTGENINLSGNIHHLQQNNFNQWTGAERFLYDYYINGNPITLSGQRTGLMGNDPTGYSKISGLTFSGSNLELTNFQVFGVSPLVNLELAPSFTFGQLITGFLRYPNSSQESCRILSGSVALPTGFTLNSIPQRLSGLTNASGGFNIITNLSPQHSDIPLTYNVTLNLLTDFGLLSKSFTTTGLPNAYVSFFINVNGAYFDLYNIPSGVTYGIESSFFSGNQEYAKSIAVEFNYAGGLTGIQEDSASFYGSGTRNINFDIEVTGTGIFTFTGLGLASGYYNNELIFGTGNLSGSFQTGITGGNFQKTYMITGSGNADTNHFNLTTFIISGYRTGVLSSGTIVRSGTLTGYIYPFLSGSGTATFSNGFRSILNSNVPLGIVRSTQIFTGEMIYRVSKSGMVRITGFNSTYLDYSGYSAGTNLTGLLEGEGFIYSALLNQVSTTGILRSELNNRKITGRRDLFITEYVTNTGINLAKIVTMVSGEATGNYINNPDIFGLSILGTGTNIVTGRNFIFGQGLITGINTGFIIKDSYVTTGLVSGIFLYQATGNPSNLSDIKNNIIDFYSANITGNINFSGFNLTSDINFTGEITSLVKFTGLIVEQGTLYSDPINFTGLNTPIYSSLSGGFKTGRFVKVFNNTILEQTTYFTGTGLFSNRVFSTGTSSGVNWTYFTVSGSGFANRIFTGIISDGSGDVYHVSTANAFNTSGVASGQIGNFVLNGPRLSAGTYVSALKNQFFTGNKTEFRQIIVSGLASGTKYNYQGLITVYSGYPFSSGSGFATGSGFILLTGRGVLTGTDGSTGLFSTTGNILALLTGNPANISDPINIFYKNYNRENPALTTGSGFFAFYNLNLGYRITGQSQPLTLSGEKYILIEDFDGFALIPPPNVYIGSGFVPNSNRSIGLFSGILAAPQYRETGITYFTGTSNQIIEGIVSGIVTGINSDYITGTIFNFGSQSVILTGLLTGTNFGIVAEDYGTKLVSGIRSNITASGVAQSDIRTNFIETFNNQTIQITGRLEGTGTFRYTGLYSGFTSSLFYTGLDCLGNPKSGKVYYLDGDGKTLYFEEAVPTFDFQYWSGLVPTTYQATGFYTITNGMNGYFSDYIYISGSAKRETPIFVYEINFGGTINCTDGYNLYPNSGIFTGLQQYVFEYGTGWVATSGFARLDSNAPFPLNTHRAHYATGITGLWFGTGYHKFTSGVVFSVTDPNYSSGILTGHIFGKPAVFDPTSTGYSGIQFYTRYTTGQRLFPVVFNSPVSGLPDPQYFNGSGNMRKFVFNTATGYLSTGSGVYSYIGLKTGYKDYIMTGFFLEVNNNIRWTGNFLTGIGFQFPFYTGGTLIRDIVSNSYETTIFRTGFVNLLPADRYFETPIESEKLFIATGYINFRSGIDFVESNQGRKTIDGILLTGTGSVILPANVFPISTPNFSGTYNFISTGTGLMTVTGFRQIIISDLLTGVTGIWETTGFSNVTGSAGFFASDLGFKSLTLNYTGQAITGTLYPRISVYPGLFEIKSGFNHITTSTLQFVQGSGFMTGYLATNQSLAARSGVSGNLEFLGNITGFTTGVITGVSGTVLVSVTGGLFDSVVTIPYNRSNTITGIFNFFKTFTRTGIFEGTGSALTTGLYRSKTNFLVSGLATGYFQITGTGSVDLTGSVVLNRSQTLLINYPYPSGNSIAYITVTGLNNFTGDFRSGVKITGLYNKNYIGFFSGSASGSYTGLWSGTGLFTGSNTIPFFDTDFGVKNPYLVAATLINSGLESGLVPVFTIGLYSGLKTIGNISLVENRNITGSGYFEKISSGFALAGTTSGSGMGLVTGYLSGFLNKSYMAGINYETGLILTGYLSGNSNIILTGIFTGTIALTGRIINSNFDLRSSGIATGYYLANKSFTGGFELYTGVTSTGEFIKITPTSPTGWILTTDIKTGQILYLQINSTNIFDNISGYFNARVFSGGLTGSVDNNIIYASRLY